MAKTDIDLAVQELTDEVTEITTVNASAVAALNGFADLVASNVNDPPALRALVATMKDSAATVVTAIQANTSPAPPAPAPAPTDQVKRG